MADENDIESEPFEVSGPPQPTPTPKSREQQIQENIFKPDEAAPTSPQPWFPPAPTPKPKNPPIQQKTFPNPTGPINVPNPQQPPPWVNVTPVADSGGDDSTQPVAFDPMLSDQQGFAATTGGDIPQPDSAVAPSPDSTTVATADNSEDGTT